MKVHVSVLGRFHAFDLARELARRDALARLVTSYPRFAAKRFGVPAERVSSVLSTELLRRGWNALPRAVAAGRNAQRFLCEHFETRAARRVAGGADVFVGWSGCSLAALERAAALGMTTVVERGSVHIDEQVRIVREEYERHGLPPVLPHPAVVEKELAEYERADFIAVPSRFALATFVARGVDPAKLLHLPYGVSLRGFHPPLYTCDRNRDPVFRIVQVGGVNLRKGCHTLLEAFASLDLPDAELCFVGPVAPEMARFRERWASDRVVFHGPVPQHELVHHYGRSHVFCLASIQEGLAMVTAQAMACALPVVATASSGAGDLVQDGFEGLLVPSGDAGALAEKIRWLHENRDAARAMGLAGRAKVEAGFGWEHYGERALAAYERAHARRAGDASGRSRAERERAA